MPYAIIDLADKSENGCRVAMVSEAQFPFAPIEEEWLEEDDELPPLPPGWPEKSYAVFLSEREALKIAAALAIKEPVFMDSIGYANIGEGESLERFRLEAFRTEAVFLGAALEHLLFVSGKISRQQYQECRQSRQQQLNKITS